MAVADLWHRTLVYFGMADEDYDDYYDDDYYSFFDVIDASESMIIFVGILGMDRFAFAEFEGIAIYPY